MFILGNLFIAIAGIIDMLLFLAYWLILIRVLVSWVNPDPYNTFVQFLYRTTDPILDPIRRLTSTMGRFDFSPIIAFILIIFLQSFLVASIKDIGYRLRYPKQELRMEVVPQSKTRDGFLR